MYPGGNNYGNQYSGYPSNQNQGPPMPGGYPGNPGYGAGGGAPPIGFQAGGGGPGFNTNYQPGMGPPQMGGQQQMGYGGPPMGGGYNQPGQMTGGCVGPPQVGGGYGQPAPMAGGYGQPGPMTGGCVGPPQVGGGYGQPAPMGGGYGQPGQMTGGGYGQSGPMGGAPPQTGYSGVTSQQPSAPGSNWGGGGHPTTKMQQDISASGEQYRGTIKPATNFNAEHDSNILRKAMKGLGTDENTIIECLGRRSLKQRLEIKIMFKTMFGKDLIDELKSELSGDFKRAVVESLYDSDYYDAYSLRKAMEGAGTKENILTEILCSRSNKQIENIKEIYKKMEADPMLSDGGKGSRVTAAGGAADYNRNLEKDVISETSGFYKRVLVSCLQANKKELSAEQLNMLHAQGPNSIIDANLARQEAQELYQAGEKKVGTDEACFIRIFALRNRYQLKATFDAYQMIAKKDIIKSIESEMSGDLASALKAMALLALDPPNYFASRLNKSMKGAGTNDGDLIRILISRSEIDLQNVKMEFQKQYGKTLESFVTGDSSGDYKKFLMRFVQGN